MLFIDKKEDEIRRHVSWNRSTETRIAPNADADNWGLDANPISNGKVGDGSHGMKLSIAQKKKRERWNGIWIIKHIKRQINGR